MSGMTPPPAAAPSPQNRLSWGSKESQVKSSSNPPTSFSESLVPVGVLALGFIVRLIPAIRLYLNPDEALHNLLASQSSISQAWAAALTNAHPPLLILLLYYWRMLGQAEWWLRMPSVLAGTASCWLLYQWLKLVTDRSTAFLGLLLACFAPSLILLSAEIRQYALLLFFMTACLYFSECALQNDSPARMVWFSLSLYGALLTHYSALIFAFVMGVYVLVSLYPRRNHLRLFAVWSTGQVVGVAIATYFLLTHIPKLKATGMVSADLESYLRKSTFHAGERNPLEFLATQTLRVFTYIFSHGLIGTLALLAFVAGLVWLFRRGIASNGGENHDADQARPSPRMLALLMVCPFLVSWAVALAGLYPLGATRHDAFLAPFMLTGICLGIAGWVPARNWTKALAVVICLGICNFFPAPPPPIRARDQSKPLMRDAMSYLRSNAAPGSLLVADYESGLLLGYYLCGHGVVQVFPPTQPFARAACGPYRVLATSFHEWKFVADTFPSELEAASQFAGDNQMLTPNTQVWFFYAGWINDSGPAMKKELALHGCAIPQNFGENIFLCRLSLEPASQR
jgi:hypothetical protein